MAIAKGRGSVGSNTSRIHFLAASGSTIGSFGAGVSVSPSAVEKKISFFFFFQMYRFWTMNITLHLFNTLTNVDELIAMVAKGLTHINFVRRQAAKLDKATIENR